MSILSRTVLSVVASLVVSAASSWAQTGIQGDVKGPDGKPLSGADVHVADKNSKQIATGKTNQQGHYVFKNLKDGTYNVTVSATGMATTAATSVKTSNGGAMRIDFELKRAIAGAQANAPAPAKKKAKRMIWVASETGTNLGGRWVEVDDGGKTEAGAFNVKRAGAGAVSSVQAGGGTAKGGN
jgi:hypothetical protein